MYTVYALYSETHQKIYIGFTSDLKARVASHNSLSEKGYTKKYRPWKVIFIEEFLSKTDAMRREKQLKSAKGREFVWNLIKDA